MASQLSQQDSKFLDANLLKKVGTLPHEDGLWGSQGNRDFVHFQLFDENDNLIQYENSFVHSTTLLTLNLVMKIIISFSLKIYL